MPRKLPSSFDVVVVGGGGSGLAAAVRAAERGLSVVLLEKMDKLGGTTGIAVGSFTANRTPHQRREGLTDNPDDHEADASRFGPPEVQARNNTALRRHFLEHSAETLEWLMGFRLAFHGPSPEPPNRVPRMHNVVPNAKAYIAVLQSRLMRCGGTIRCSARVTRLVMDDGRVSGVEFELDGCGPIALNARRGVVLAAGDYANSARLISQHKGPQFVPIEGINPHSTGDGHVLAEQVGAELVNMDITYGPEIRFVPPPRKPFSQLLPGGGSLAWVMSRCLRMVPRWIIQRMIKRLLVTWQHPEDALFNDGAVLLNSRGERFCNELASPDREIAIAGQPGKVAFLLLDGRLVERYSRWPHFVSTAPEIAYAYVADYCRMRPDITTRADDLESIAAANNLPAESVRHAVERFNAAMGGTVADDFGRPASAPPLAQAPWVMLGPLRAYFTTTEGGARVNTQMQVLNPAGEPIPGCYAVGQNGLGGVVLWGHGLHIAWAMTSGRLAADALARRPELQTDRSRGESSCTRHHGLPRRGGASLER